VVEKGEKKAEKLKVLPEVSAFSSAKAPTHTLHFFGEIVS
jgi:hypothetical protein